MSTRECKWKRVAATIKCGVFFTLCLAGQMAVGQDELTSREVFDEKLLAAETRVEEMRSMAFRRYLTHIEHLASRAISEGNLDEVDYLNSHLASVESEQQIAYEFDPAAPQALKQHHSMLRRMLEMISKKEVTSKKALIQEFQSHLESQESDSIEAEMDLMYLSSLKEEITLIEASPKGIVYANGHVPAPRQALPRVSQWTNRVEDDSNTDDETEEDASSDTNAAPSGFSPNPDQLRQLQHAVVHIEAGDSRGTGFFAEIDGEDYLITNLHVALSPDRLVIRTIDSREIRLKAVDVASQEDMVRFRFEAIGGLGEITPLKMAPATPTVGSKIVVYGNSDGAGASTVLPGEVQAVGPDIIEVSSEFVPGNSGSPIVNERMEVLGVASYVSREKMKGDWTKEGTRFTDTRRFAYRISSNSHWIHVSPASFKRQAVIMNDYSMFLTEICEAIRSIKGTRGSRLSINGRYDRAKALKRYDNPKFANAMAQLYQSYGSKNQSTRSYSGSAAHRRNQQMAKAFGRQLASAGEEMRKFKWTSGWMREDGRHYAEVCEEISTYLENY